jgi:hypothetical protein
MKLLNFSLFLQKHFSTEPRVLDFKINKKKLDNLYNIVYNCRKPEKPNRSVRAGRKATGLLISKRQPSRQKGNKALSLAALFFMDNEHSFIRRQWYEQV